LGTFFIIGGIFFKLGANVLVEYKNVFLTRGIFYNWGQFFPNLGQFGANVLVEFENVFLIGGIFCN